MPWQRWVLDVALEMDPETERLVYREAILTVPRQSGKTTLLLVLILLRALRSPPQSIRYTAQTGSDARKKWTDDWLPQLKATKFTSLYRVRLSNGNEALLFNNGSMQGLLATTIKSGHGPTVDLGILDEAFAHTDARLEQALKPSMMTRPEPQLWIVSTAGTPETSPYLLSKVEMGRQLAETGVNSGVAYFEWSPEDGLDPSDPATWRSCMPALGYTVTEEAVAADYQSMLLDGKSSEFERAYLNRWKKAINDPAIPLDVWNALIDLSSKRVGPVCFAFDVAPDRKSGAIAVAGTRHDGLSHVEVIEHKSGTDWIAPLLADLLKKNPRSPVVCDPGGPAGGLLADLAARKVKVVTAGTKEHGQACGMLYDAVMQGALRHLGTPELAIAIDGGVKRTVHDVWLWSRKSSSIDISPLVAVTLAYWGAKTQKRGSSQVINMNDYL